MNTTDSKDEALKPCPFCGSEAFISFDGDIGVPDDWSANCKNTLPCGATVQGISSEKDARKAWNSRASVAAVEVDAKLVEQIVEAVWRNVQRYDDGDIWLDTLKATAKVKKLLHAAASSPAPAEPAQHQPATPVVARESIYKLALIAIAKDDALECECGVPPYIDGNPCAKCTAIQALDATTAPDETAVGGDTHAKNPNAFCLVCNEHPCKLITAANG